MQILEAGGSLALVSDAGTPGIADPGATLAALAHSKGIRCYAVAGPSAITAALSVSGLEFGQFHYAGWAPRTGKERAKWLEGLARSVMPVVFLEAPHRMKKMLVDLCSRLEGSRRLVVCRELTKVHEEVLSRPLQDWQAGLDEMVFRGEYTLVLEATSAKGISVEAARPMLRELMACGIEPGKVAAATARLTGLPRQQLYQEILAMGSADAPPHK